MKPPARPPPQPATGAASRQPWRSRALVAAALVAGCDVRDETVRIEPTAAAWQVPVFDATSGRDALAAGPAGIEYVEGYDDAARRAAAAGMPLLLVFRAGWCRHSAALAAGPLAADGIVARSRRFVCAAVDADRDAATCRSFAVQGFPTVIVVDARGRERFRTTGAALAGLAGALDAVAGPAASGPHAAAADRPDSAIDRRVVR